LRTSAARGSLDGVNRRGNLRASDEDRDRIVAQLHKAATEGRIASDELEQRVAAALKARTYAELEETVADLPRPRSRQTPVRHSTAGWVLSTVRANPILLVLAIPVLAVTAAVLLAATVLWTVMVLVVLMVGGRHRMGRGPWSAGRYGWGDPRGRPRGNWM
jgi:small-conductance mechanosensitive channel